LILIGIAVLAFIHDKTQEQWRGWWQTASGEGERSSVSYLLTSKLKETTSNIWIDVFRTTSSSLKCTTCAEEASVKHLKLVCCSTTWMYFTEIHHQTRPIEAIRVRKRLKLMIHRATFWAMLLGNLAALLLLGHFPI